MERRSVFIALVLALNLAGPLRYYARPTDPYDERFAWRMFSPVRMLRCEANFRVGGEPLALGEQFHSAWITLVQRGRADVTDAVTQRICMVNPGKPVTLDYRCRELGGAVRTLSTPDRDLCPERR